MNFTTEMFFRVWFSDIATNHMPARGMGMKLGIGIEIEDQRYLVAAIPKHVLQM